MVRAVARELIDDPGIDPQALAKSLRGLESANRRFGGHAVVLRELERLRRGGHPPRRLVDVGAGNGDLAEAAVAWGRRRGLPVGVLCVDAHPAVVDVARVRRSGVPGLAFAQGDGRRLDLANRSVDAALCTLVLHHLEPDDAVALLRELRRVSRITPIVADLVRGPIAYAQVWLWSHALVHDPLIRHDGPLSVCRAYTPHEAISLARAAGWSAPRVRVASMLRMVLTDG